MMALRPVCGQNIELVLPSSIQGLVTIDRANKFGRVIRYSSLKFSNFKITKKKFSSKFELKILKNKFYFTSSQKLNTYGHA